MPISVEAWVEVRTPLAAAGPKVVPHRQARPLKEVLQTVNDPDLRTDGRLIFDAPQDKVNGSMLEVSGIFGGGEACTDLGL